MSEAPDIRLKRLRLRSWRRGIKEMDLILGGFADAELATLGEAELGIYERMLEENDHDLYLWASEQGEVPSDYAALLSRAVALTKQP